MKYLWWKTTRISQGWSIWPLTVIYSLPTSILQNNKPFWTKDLLNPSNRCCVHRITMVDNVGICIHIFPFLDVSTHLKFNVSTQIRSFGTSTVLEMGLEINPWWNTRKMEEMSLVPRWTSAKSGNTGKGLETSDETRTSSGLRALGRGLLSKG